MRRLYTFVKNITGEKSNLVYTIVNEQLAYKRCTYITTILMEVFFLFVSSTNYFLTNKVSYNQNHRVILFFSVINTIYDVREMYKIIL